MRIVQRRWKLGKQKKKDFHSVKLQDVVSLIHSIEEILKFTRFITR